MRFFHVGNRLTAYHHGALPPGSARRVAGHLQRCARCRAESESVRAVMNAAEELPLHSAPAALWSDIESALDTPSAVSSRSRWPLILSLAAGLAACALAAFLLWPRAPGNGWTMVRLDGSAVTSTAKLAVGAWLVTGPAERAKVTVGDIGEVEVAPNSRVRLVRARPSDNRLSLDRGEISARIWAPPRLFFVETPSAVAVDLGCAYTLQVDPRGSGLLRVTTGWVMLEDRGRESMVPAGAACRTRRGFGPGTPYFEDAGAGFQRALDSFDFGPSDPGALATLIKDARPRDGFTLVHLLTRADVPERRRIYDRLAALSPVPKDVSRAGALAADPATLQRWLDELAWNW